MVTTLKREAIIILKKTKIPMTSKQILQEIIKRNKIKLKSSTPVSSLASVIYTDIKENGGNSPFIITEKLNENLKKERHYSIKK
ncbi:MAG: winged helix-turn-helix domain-containing protein [Nanobdellota archaeon]